MDKTKLIKTRTKLLLTGFVDYIRGYSIYKRGRGNLIEPYNISYNLYFKDLVKEVWTTGTWDRNNYIKQDRPVFKPQLRKK